MELSDSSVYSLQEFIETPPKERSIGRLGGIFWKTLVNRITDLIHEGGDTGRFLSEEKDFIDYGLTKEFFEDFNVVSSAVRSGAKPYPPIAIRFLTEWIADTLLKIYRADKKELLDKDIKRLELERKQLSRECAEQQAGRKELLQNEFSGTTDLSLLKSIENLGACDVLYQINLQTKRATSMGAFMSVEERRIYSARAMRYQEEMEKCELLFARVKSEENRKSLRNFNNQIYEVMDKVAVCYERIKGKQRELSAVENETQAISPMEVEGRIRTELEYVRDMARLSARRLRLTACSILVPGAPFFTMEKLIAAFDRIIEFDPTLFNNDRVKIFGRPTALIVPGNGNAVYDWKNNQFVIPLVPPGGDFMGSIATGVIEYRIDVDDEKTMMTSYQKVPENRGVKSLVTLRAKMTKDYLTWMTSEYNGFKVLGKEARAWFEREIAPKKSEIFCPLEYQPFVLSQEQVKKVAGEIEARLSGQGAPAPADLWGASIIAYQEGRYAEAAQRLQTLIETDGEFVFAYFNLGVVGMKTMNKPQATGAFIEFIKRNPRSWWTSVVTEHLRRLQESA
jgi:tetratricopeptide (TPR) repeat protein